jgi:AcrR family transcriptional regulator
MNDPTKVSSILSFYEESRTRRLKRRLILEVGASLEYRGEMAAITMSDFADRVGLERRTLYTYYRNKADLVVDSYLHVIEDVTTEGYDEMLARWDSSKSVLTPENLAKALLDYSEMVYRLYGDFPDSRSYETILAPVPKDSETSKRFFHVRKMIAARTDFVSLILKDYTSEEGIAKGLHRELGLIVEQGLRAYVVQVSLREGLASHYRKENFVTYVAILARGVLSQLLVQGFLSPRVTRSETVKAGVQ